MSTTPAPQAEAVVDAALAVLRARAKRDRLSGRLGIVVFVHYHVGEERTVETLECAPPEKRPVR